MCMVTRMNVSFPSDLVEKLKKVAPKRGISRFLAEAIEEKVRAIERKRALKELLALPPAFPEIKNGAAYIRKLRRLDERRMRRLGL